MKKFATVILFFLIIAVTVTGCGNIRNKDYMFEDNGKYKVVTTTTMLTDLVKKIGGKYIDVYGLMGPGIDPHLYKASAGDVILMQKADMIVYGGLNLEGKMGEVFENLRDIDKLVVCAADGIDKKNLIKVDGDSNVYDPHVWFDVNIWEDEAIEVAKGLKKLDKKHSKEFDANLESYLSELKELNNYIVKRVSEIPEDKRILITAHDAFNYFAKAYGFKVKGLQGISTSAEAGTSNVRQLSDFIVEHQIKAVFIETSIPKKNMEALQEAVEAKNFQVKIGGELYSDSLGDPDTSAGTYIGTFKHNIDTIVDALK